MLEELGTFLQLALPIAAFVFCLLKRDRIGFWQMAKYLIIVIAITWIFKLGLAKLLGINEIRPHGGRWSFPSGHTASAFTGAMFLSLRYGKKYALIALPLAIYVAFSRIYANMHWPRDVVAAAVLAIVSGLLVVKPYKGN